MISTIRSLLPLLSCLILPLDYLYPLAKCNCLSGTVNSVVLGVGMNSTGAAVQVLFLSKCFCAHVGKLILLF